MKTKILSLLYFLSGGLFLFLEDHGSFFSGLVTKAMIIPLLMILLIVNIRKVWNLSAWLISAGLFFSWAGDVALEFSQKNGNMFITGLACFLIAHLMYFTLFFRTPGKNVINKRFYLLIPVVLYGAVLLFFLYDDLGDMQLPVTLYAFVILIMLTGAISRIGKVKRSSYYLVLAGAILFVLSDSLIAINKFSYHFEYSSIAIMSTYVAAQFLIIIGYILQFRDKFE